ncbi:MAG: sugar transporter [Bacteroidota bacterium]
MGFFSRKVFLDSLGDAFIGLVSLLQNILRLLNLAELGISTAIGYTLYQPLYDKNKPEINSIIYYFATLYKKIGILILSIGFLVSLALPWFIAEPTLPNTIIFLTFYTFLTSALLGYFLNYYQTLLEADQKQYLIVKYAQSIAVIKTILQIVFAYAYENYYIWITIELVFTVTYAIILRRVITKTYPWLNLNFKNQQLKKYPDILTKIKQVFVHKIAYFIKWSKDQILIHTFFGITSVAFYGNYQLIFGHLHALVNKFFSGSQAGVGNLISENKPENIKKVFWEMMAVRHFFAGFIVITLYHLTEPFVNQWIGEKYLMEKAVLIVMLMNIYATQIKSPVEYFINAYGLYSDIWAPIVEISINLTLSILLGRYLGIYGVLLGTFIGTFIIFIIWKPYFLYMRGFKLPIKDYWIGFFKLFICFLGAFVLIFFMANTIILFQINNFLDWFLYAMAISTLTLIIYCSMLYVLNQGFRDLVVRVKIFKWKRKRK